MSDLTVKDPVCLTAALQYMFVTNSTADLSKLCWLKFMEMAQMNHNCKGVCCKTKSAD